MIGSRSKMSAVRLECFCYWPRWWTGTSRNRSLQFPAAFLNRSSLKLQKCTLCTSKKHDENYGDGGFSIIKFYCY